MFYQCNICFRIRTGGAGYSNNHCRMIDQGVLRSDENYLIQMGLVILLISIIGVSMTILLGFCCANFYQYHQRYQNDIFEKAQKFTAHEFNQFGISSMITRTNNDAFQIQMFVNVLLRTA